MRRKQNFAQDTLSKTKKNDERFEPEVWMKKQLLLKSRGRLKLVLAVVVALAASGINLYSFFISSRFTTQSRMPTPSVSAPSVRAVTALGRLEPQGEVIHLSVPTILETQKRVAQLLVKEGDRVQLGQVVAILDIFDDRQFALERAQKQVKVAQARLAKVKAGAQVGEISAQKAVIGRLEAQMREQIPAQEATIVRFESQLSNAQAEYARYDKLYKEGAVAISLSDSKRLVVETTQQQINEAKANLKVTLKTLTEQIKEAKATLERITEIRPVDVNEAQADVENAIASVKQAKADLELTYVRAPKAGRILAIHTRAGEVVKTEGIAELGQTDQMYAVAEVYESDIGKVRPGQQATITSDIFTGKLSGTVTQIGWQIRKKDVLNADPVEDINARVIEVKIRLNSQNSLLVTKLTNLQVEVKINI